jgi:hypothetical protein
MMKKSKKFLCLYLQQIIKTYLDSLIIKGGEKEDILPFVY